MFLNLIILLSRFENIQRFKFLNHLSILGRKKEVRRAEKEKKMKDKAKVLLCFVYN